MSDPNTPGPRRTQRPPATVPVPSAFPAPPGPRTNPPTRPTPILAAPLPADATRPIALRSRASKPEKRLRVDWPACKAHGLCHELLPEVIGLDEWGFPVVGMDALRGTRLDDAKRAVAACPTLALRLVDIP